MISGVFVSPGQMAMLKTSKL
jgi:addiction module HigA family antidote